jgi:putative membrane protein
MTNRSFALAVLMIVSACAEEPGNNASDRIEVTGQSAGAAGQPSAAEAKGQEFVSAVLGDYSFSLESARLAEQKAERANVKQFAAKLREGLAASQAELTAIATAASLRTEPAPGETHQTDLAVLSSTSGVPLEQAFAEQQIEALTGLVGLIRAYKNGGDNPALKAWAEKAQSVVNERLLDAQTLNAELQEAAER